MRELRVADLTANVVDIRRFSTHDGAGIRTTVYLKGCTLACAWCQNPETISPKLSPVFFRNRCIDCGKCVEHATAGEARFGSDGHVRVDTQVAEADWDAQAKLCPTGAISFDGVTRTIPEIVEIVGRDRVFFGDEGGVTLSGGEPLFRPHFAAGLLRALQADGINTAIETALNVRTEFLLEAVPYCDHIFADCKMIDPQEHKQYIGTDNDLILANLRVLLTGGRRDDVTIRTPLIPGVTATRANIEGIASFLAGLYPDVCYELLNYNPLAAAKYDVQPGREYLFQDGENPRMFTKAEMEEFREIARSQGLTNVVPE